MYFKMTGKLNLGKETEKFKPYEEKTFSTGYHRKQLKFNAVCGNNMHFLTLMGMIDGNNKIYVRTKDNEKEKGKFIQVPFSQRFDPKIAEDIEYYNKFILDLDYAQRRYSLKRMLDNLQSNGQKPTVQDLAEVGLKSADEIESAYKISCEKRHEFISAIDMIDELRKIIDSTEYKNAKFNIQGKGEYSYYKGKVYTSYIPNSIYLAKDNEEEMSQANLKLYFNKDSMKKRDDSCIIDGFIREYDGNLRKLIPVPTSVVIRKPLSLDSLEEKKYERIISKFKSDDKKWYEYGVTVDMLNGSQKVEITMDMLDEEQREDVECGLITLEDIAEEMGGNAFGEKIQEYRFYKPMKGYSAGKKETVFEDYDFIITRSDDEYDDLFDKKSEDDYDDDEI